MITQIDITNFRSIRQQSIPLKKLNILYGPNGSGKSSVGYAPYVLRNFFANPNQHVDSLFNLGFINLGGLDNVCSITDDIRIQVVIELKEMLLYDRFPEISEHLSKYSFFLGKNQQRIFFDFGNIHELIEFKMPYSYFRREEIILYQRKILWNGLTFDNISDDILSLNLCKAFNSGYEFIKNFEIISVKRGFFSQIFSTELPTDESVFAMQIRNEGTSFESKIDHYFKKLFNKTFRFVAIPGSTSFYLKTQDAKGFSIDLVNEGFGVNQTLYMLIKLLKKNTSLAFIEEPEIHLHPSAQAKLVDVFTEIIKKENKQIFLTTHSENIVSSVLAKIAKGELDKNDVQFYLAKNEDDETKIIPQEVNDKGQIEGGLMNFMETELSNLKTLLGI